MYMIQFGLQPEMLQIPNLESSPPPIHVVRRKGEGAAGDVNNY